MLILIWLLSGLDTKNQTAGGTSWPKRWGPPSPEWRVEGVTQRPSHCCPHLKLPAVPHQRRLQGSECTPPSAGARSRLSSGWTGPLVSSVYLWEQPEESRLETPLSLEDQILNSMFEACDPQRTGGRGRMGPGSLGVGEIGNTKGQRWGARNWGALEREMRACRTVVMGSFRNEWTGHGGLAGQDRGEENLGILGEEGGVSLPGGGRERGQPLRAWRIADSLWSTF